ncbi:hypothetical protein SNE40_018909 [Patella caerulea]|uniref:Thioredoxin domain-containing protein n=1 Tax=Patella caerulea TaxID=87958 RepID=A0AAN8PHC7_PATCE
MARHPEIFLVVTAIFIIFLGRYGTSLQAKTITEPPKEPKRFFPSFSPVLDLPYGNLEPVVNILEKDRFIFVMYYAPWCAKSMTMRWEFQKAAKFMQNQVKFIGINCWWPEGSCRKRYKFVMFPVLYAYFSQLDGYRYLGSASAEYMVKFLEDLTYPLSLLHTQDEVVDVVAKYDTAVVAYFGFNTSPQPPGYLQYYYASMRSVEHDPYQVMKYCVITQFNLASVYNLTNISDIVLMRSSNTSLKFPSDANYTSSYIVSWVLQNRQKPVIKWITPLGVKSLTLSRQISLGPSLVLFTPINQLFDINIYIHMLKNIALHFTSDCVNDTSFSSNTIINSYQLYSLNTLQKYNDIVSVCNQLKKQSLSKVYSAKCCVTLANQSSSKNVCEVCHHKQSFSPILPSSSNCAIDVKLHTSILPTKTLQDIDAKICHNSRQNYNTNEHSSFCCETCAENKMTIESEAFNKNGRRRTDRYVYQNLELLPLRLCKRLTLQKLQGLYTVPDLPDFDIPSNFTNLGCKQNRSLGFYAIDSMHHSLFAKRLGVDMERLAVLPTAVIIDREAEEHYILKENFTATNVVSFIVNFTIGRLRRALLSHEPVVNTCTEDDMCIAELTSQTFQQYINRQHQDVVVLVYAPWCGFCTSVNHLYLSLAKYFKTNTNIVFTRIDGDSNDLPWEYTVEQYPTIMFFPANRKSDSVVYPESVPYTLSNLVRFILKHSTFKLRTEAAVSVCTKTCIQRNREYAQRMAYLLKQRLNRLRTRLRLITRSTTDYVEYAVSVLSEKIQKLSTQLETVNRFYQYLQKTHHQIEYSQLAKFIVS